MQLVCPCIKELTATCLHLRSAMPHDSNSILSSKETGEETVFFGNTTHRDGETNHHYSRITGCALPALFSFSCTRRADNIEREKRTKIKGRKRSTSERHGGCSALIERGRRAASCRQFGLLFILHCLVNSRPGGSKKQTHLNLDPRTEKQGSCSAEANGKLAFAVSGHKMESRKW